jgi:small basic protein
VSAFDVLLAFGAAPGSWLPGREVIGVRALVCAPTATLEAAVPPDPGVESAGLLATTIVATGVCATVAAAPGELAATCGALPALPSDWPLLESLDFFVGPDWAAAAPVFSAFTAEVTVAAAAGSALALPVALFAAVGVVFAGAGAALACEFGAVAFGSGFVVGVVAVVTFCVAGAGGVVGLPILAFAAAGEAVILGEEPDVAVPACSVPPTCCALAPEEFALLAFPAGCDCGGDPLGLVATLEATPPPVSVVPLKLWLPVPAETDAGACCGPGAGFGAGGTLLFAGLVAPASSKAAKG